VSELTIRAGATRSPVSDELSVTWSRLAHSLIFAFDRVRP
jgi:hypothetical protein